MLIWKPSNNKWRHNDVFTKTMSKFGPPRNQTKYKSFERYWWELSRNVLFIEFEPLCQKLWAFLSNFGSFYDARSWYDMVIWSCQVTQDANFEIFYFVLILHLISGEVTKFPVEKLSISEVISKKPHGGGKHPLPPPPPPSAFRVKSGVSTWIQRKCHFYQILHHF